MDDKEDTREALSFSSRSSFRFPSPPHSLHGVSFHPTKVMGMETVQKRNEDRSSSSSSETAKKRNQDQSSSSSETVKKRNQDPSSSITSPLFQQVQSMRRLNTLKSNRRKTNTPKDVPSSASSPPSISVSRSDTNLMEDNLMNGNQRERDMVVAPSSFPGVDGSYPPSLAVCVEVSKNSKYGVQWALDTLVSEGESIQIIHVKHPIQSVPTPMGNYMPVTLASKTASKAYRQEVDSQTNGQLMHYLHMCQRRKVHAQIILLEEYSAPLAIAKHISRCHIQKVVMGSSSRNLFTRMLKTPDVPTRVARIAPKFCTIYVISKRKLVSVHSAFASNRISISYDDNGSTVSGRTSDASSSSLQIPLREKSDFEVINGNMLPSQSLPGANQDLSLGNQTTSPIIMNQEYAELHSDKRIREDSSSIGTHGFLGTKRSQELNVSIESESSPHGSISEQYQLTEKNDAEGATCYDHKRRLQDPAEISKVPPITGNSDERFISNGNQLPWNGYSNSDSCQHNQGSGTLNPNTNMEESMFSVESQFLRNNEESQIQEVDSFSSKSKEGDTKVNQYTSSIKEKQYHKESMEFQAYSADHLRFSSAVELAEENEAFFEISPSKIQESRPWVPSIVEKFSVASINLDIPKSDIEIHSNSSPPMLMGDFGTELEELKLQIKRIVFMYKILYEESVSARRKAEELDLQRVEEANQLKEAKLREKRALAIAAEEKARRETAVEELELAKRIAKVEIKRRKEAEFMINNKYTRDISLVDTLPSDNHRLEKSFQR